MPGSKIKSRTGILLYTHSSVLTANGVDRAKTFSQH